MPKFYIWILCNYGQMAPFVSSKTGKPYLLVDEVSDFGISLLVAGAVTIQAHLLLPNLAGVGLQDCAVGLLCLCHQPAAVFIPTSTGCLLSSSFFVPLCSTVLFSTMDFDLMVYLVLWTGKMAARVRKWNGRAAFIFLFSNLWPNLTV